MATLTEWPPDTLHGCPSCGAAALFIHGFGRNGRLCDACDTQWDAEELGWRLSLALERIWTEAVWQ